MAVAPAGNVDGACARAGLGGTRAGHSGNAKPGASNATNRRPRPANNLLPAGYIKLEIRSNRNF